MKKNYIKNTTEPISKRWALLLKILKTVVIIIVIIVFLFAGYVIVGFSVLRTLEHHYDQIDSKMSRDEVRNLLKDSFIESAVTLKEIEDDGYGLSRLEEPYSEYSGYKYAYRYLNFLYLYVIYDKNGFVRLSIDAYE